MSKFNKATGQWEDKGGPKGIGAKKFRERAESVFEESKRRILKLDKLRMSRPLKLEEQDEYAALTWTAFNWFDTALLPTQGRERKEDGGREKQKPDEDRRDQVRAQFKPGLTARQIRKAIIEDGGGNYALRTIQDDIKILGLRKKK